jgi:PAS domain S-box-containing protein
LAVGLAGTLALYLADRQGQQRRDQARIERFADRVEISLRNRLGRYEDIVRGAQGFLSPDRAVSESEWRDYVSVLDLTRRHPGLSSLAYIVPVPAPELEAYLERRPQLIGLYHLPHADPMPLRNPDQDEDHLLIELCEPAAQSPGALGLDVGASHTRRMAAERARDSGGPALSGLLYFTNGELRQEAVALYLPVYRTPVVPGTPEGRRAALKGWASAGILLRPLMDDILKQEDQGLTFEVLDTFAAQGPQWLYISPGWPVGAAPVRVHDLDLAGRGWQVRYALRPEFSRAEGRHRPEWVLLAGLIVSGSLAAGMASLTGTRARALDLANRMTGSLHRALARNRSHLEHTPLAMIETDPEFRILEWNPAAERIFGYSRAEMLGADPRILVPGESQAELDQRRRALVEGRGEGIRITLQILCRTGQRRLCDWYITALRDENGRFAGATFLADDITDRRRADDALRQAQKLESLGVLAGGIAHDFNNLLTAILGNTEVALGRIPDDPGLREALQRIEATTQRGADLARQLLAYAGKGHFAVKPQNLNRIIQEMGDLLTVSISKKVALCYDLQPGLPPVEADSAQFQQVVMNLVINASEAIGDKSGTITLRTRTVSYTREELAEGFPGQVLEPGLFVRMEVGDDGCGMDAETIGRIFDPFFSTKFTGRGLGLSAMLGIVRGHQAGIHVESIPDVGTTFILLFPASEATVFTEPEPREEPRPVPGTVLVVDDEAIIRELAREALESAGLKVIEARDGQEAVDLFRECGGQVDLVLLDMTMPRMGGAEAFHLIRQMAPSARVLLTSGYTQQESLDSLANLDPNGFLQKPFRVRDLVAKAREVMAVPRPD